jgi:hypothetical protein
MGQMLTARLTRLHVARRALELDLPFAFIAALLETSVSNLYRGGRLRRILDGELPLPIDESAFERWSDAELMEVVERWRKRRMRTDEPDVLKEPTTPSAPSSPTPHAAPATATAAAADVPAVSAPTSAAAATPPIAVVPTPAESTAARAAPTTTEPVAVRVHEHVSPASTPAHTAPTAPTATCDVEPLSKSNRLVRALEKQVSLTTIDDIVVIAPNHVDRLMELSPRASVMFLQQYGITWNLDLVTLTRAAIAALSFGLLPTIFGYLIDWRSHVFSIVNTDTGLPVFAAPPKVKMAWSNLADVEVPDAYEHEAIEAAMAQLTASTEAVLADRATTDEERKARDLLTAVGLPDLEHLPLPPSEWTNRTAAARTKRYLKQQWKQQDDTCGTQFWWHRSHSETVLKMLDKFLAWN